MAGEKIVSPQSRLLCLDRVRFKISLILPRIRKILGKFKNNFQKKLVRNLILLRNSKKILKKVFKNAPEKFVKFEILKKYYEIFC